MINLFRRFTHIRFWLYILCTIHPKDILVCAKCNSCCDGTGTNATTHIRSCFPLRMLDNWGSERPTDTAAIQHTHISYTHTHTHAGRIKTENDLLRESIMSEVHWMQLFNVCVCMHCAVCSSLTISRSSYISFIVDFVPLFSFHRFHFFHCSMCTVHTLHTWSGARMKVTMDARS